MSESHKRTERMSRWKKQEIAEILLEAWKRGESVEKLKEELDLSDRRHQQLYYVAVAIELRKILELLMARKNADEILSIRGLDDHYLRQLYLATYEF